MLFYLVSLTEIPFELKCNSSKGFNSNDFYAEYPRYVSSSITLTTNIAVFDYSCNLTAVALMYSAKEILLLL